MKLEDYPGVSSMTTRHGKIRWRYRKSGQRDIMLPGEPGTPEFDEAYQRAILGLRAEVVPMPGAAAPRSLKAAYQRLLNTDEWRKLDAATQNHYRPVIERILSIRFGNMEVGNGPVADLKRNHIKKILEEFRHVPHMERIALICIRKLIMVAIEEEWIEWDPSCGMKRTPKTDGHKAWPADLLRRFEEAHPIGTQARTAFALALWLGNRASDVRLLKWSHLTTKEIVIDGELRTIEGFEFVQFKGRKRGQTIFLPMTPMLREALAPLPRDTEYVLLSSRGRPYTAKSISNRMIFWCQQAGIPRGYTLHGLRKSLGVKVAEADGSTRQLMEVLGHRSIAYAELYSREASKVRLATKAMDKLTELEQRRAAPRLRAVE